MSEEIKARYEKDGAMAVLERLRTLRRHAGDEASFWQEYLALMALLCRAPAVFVASRSEQGWVLTGQACLETAESAGVAATFPSLGQIGERAEQNGFAYERLPVELKGKTLPCLLMIMLTPWSEQSRLALCMVVDRTTSQQFSDIVVRAGLAADIPCDFYQGGEQQVSALSPSVPAPSHSGLHDILRVSHSIMNQSGFQQACTVMANEIAQRYNCTRVLVGWKKRGFVRLVAVSHLEEFSSDSPAVQQAESLFEEVVDQDAVIAVPQVQPYFVVDRAHKAYLLSHGLNQVVSLPIYLNDEIHGVITCEMQEGTLTPAHHESLGMLIDIVSSWLEALNHRDAWFGERLAVRLRQFASNWISGEHLAFKAGMILLMLLVLLSLVVPWPYHVEGVATLQTDQVRFVSAPFDGVVREVLVKEGDTVKAGAPLAAMDTRELHLKKSQDEADIARHAREADKSRAQNALADMRISLSRVDELHAERERTEYNLKRATMTAPEDGVVVEADTRKLIGAPVAKGDVLLKVARVAQMYLTIKVQERDVDEISSHMHGRLVLVSRPDKIFNFTVDKLIPLAEVDQHDGNIFMVRAIIAEQPEVWWRPGMSGVARIDAGKRTVAWILTHRVIDFIRMHLWW